MSLVHEALQKAEREKQRKLSNAPQAVQTAAPHSGHAPQVHAPATSSPVIVVTRDVAAHKSIAADETAPATKETNHYLLPALIACVAIVAIIAIVFLVSSASSVLRQSKDSPVTTTALAAPTPPVKPAVPAEPQAPAQPAAQIPADSAPAPSAPPTTTPTANESKFTLSGIMLDPDGKYVAIVNGHVTYEGTSVGGATVKTIEHDHAVLDVNGHEMVLRLF